MPPPSLLTLSNVNLPIYVAVANQSSMNLTFRVISMHQQKVITTNNWWPLPSWLLAAVAGALVLFLIIGIAAGYVVAKRRTGGYEAVPSITTIN